MRWDELEQRGLEALVKVKVRMTRRGLEDNAQYLILAASIEKGHPNK
jgi:hypothetical protein